ncbi:MAG: A24 family peptidase [Microthrixaceae bacterium]
MTLAAQTGWDALGSPALVAVLAWSAVSGTVVAWLAHRYEPATDDDGFEFAMLHDARCPMCDHVVTLAESAPVLSRRCRDCRSELGGSWPAAHVANLVGNLVMLLTFGATRWLLAFLWLVPVVVLAAVCDMRMLLIPRRVVHVGFAVGLALIGVLSLTGSAAGAVVTALVGAAASCLFLFVMHLISPGGLGFGDVRFVSVLGLYLGWMNVRLPLYGLLLGSVIHLLYAVPQRLAKGRDKGRFSPFGPGLATGAVLAIALSPFLLHP